MTFDKTFKIKLRNTFSQFLFILFMLFLVFFLIFFHIDSKVLEIKKSEIISKEKDLIEKEKSILVGAIKDNLSDLHFLEDSLVYYLEGKITEEDINNLWAAFANRAQIYDKIRYIDNNGDELIRINYFKSGSKICSKEDFQNKKNRYYFTDSMNLKENQHYISKLDLNIENNKIKSPIKPMLRMSSKISVNNENRGIIILNYIASDMLQEFKNNSFTSHGNIMLLNSDAYWIEGGSKEENWAFMYEDKKDINFKEKFPVEWHHIQSGEKKFTSENFIINWDYLEFIDLPDFHKNAEIISKDKDFFIVSAIDIKSKTGLLFTENFLLKAKRIFMENIFIFVMLSAIAILLEALFYVSKKSYMKIKFNSEYDGLTKVLNRETGIKMIKKLFKNYDNFSICFIDINGLKQVNDILGHKYGDELIVTVVTILKESIREKDFVIRMGGDEFLIVFPDIDTQISESIWSRIKEKFDNTNRTEGRKYIISVSHGIVENFSFEESTVEKIIKEADEKMYIEKKEIKKHINQFIKELSK